jgi:hypothetical protein
VQGQLGGRPGSYRPKGGTLIRELLIATAIVGASIGAAPAAAGDEPSGRYPTDVPGMDYDASLTGPCSSWERYIFGRGPGGEALACHYIPNQWPPVYWGFWVISYPLYGVQEIGAPCENPRGAAAQSPDGLPLVCKGSQGGWQVDQYDL